MRSLWVFLFLLGTILSIPVDEKSQALVGDIGMEADALHYFGPDVFNEDFPEENPGFFEGDIELREGEDPNDRNSITDKRKIWPNGVLPYEISSAYSSYDQTSIRNAMKTIEDKTRVNGKNCITFTPHNGEQRYIRFVSGSGCHTPVGMGFSSSAVTLGRGCLRIGTIMHEISHALGMWHEQSRHDRDNYVTIDFSNIQPGREHNFNKYQLGYIDELGEPYDYESVMHYSAYSFAQDRRKPTIIPKQRGVTIGQRTHLSPIDIKEIQILYGCISRPTGTGNSHERNFDKYQLGFIDELGQPYDYESVMHYSAYSFSKDRRKPTIIPKQRGVSIGQRTHLSPIDIKEIQILYGCIPRPTSTGNTPSPTQAPIIHGTPGTCTFENGACGWLNEAGPVGWAIREGKTPSQGTGPSGDHSGSPLGHYLYVEASGHYSQSAFLTSPMYPSGEYCLDFYFDMYGQSMGYFRVYARIGNNRQLIHQVVGDQGDRWLRYRVNIKVPSPASFKVELEGHVGTSYTSDIAIDDLTLHQGKC